VRALAVRGDDPAWRVKKEEAPFAEEDGPIVRGSEQLEELRLRSHCDRVSEPFNPVDANERRDQSRDLGRGETERTEKAETEERSPPPAQDGVTRCSEPKHRRDLPTELLRMGST
jgi:hypothetical protein